MMQMYECICVCGWLKIRGIMYDLMCVSVRVCDLITVCVCVYVLAAARQRGLWMDSGWLALCHFPLIRLLGKPFPCADWGILGSGR